MSTLVIYYSYGGTTQKLAQQLAEERGATLYQVLDQKRPSLFGAFLRCPAAMAQKNGKILPVDIALADYDDIVVMGPIWAGHPAPPVNNIIRMLPAGKAVELRMISGGGSSNQAKTIALVEGQGGTVKEYVNVKSGN